SAMDTRTIGMAVVALGGGRTDPAQKIDHSVGFTEICQIGDTVKQGQPLARVFAATEDAASAAVATFTSAVQISSAAPSLKPITAEIIRG
ncbi:MAG: thymidine phosphorylase, partial [Kordiimonadaceae bacterium]|nr:thymidine phosphorylase [Kordiimonadaceae bacterium]